MPNPPVNVDEAGAVNWLAVLALVAVAFFVIWLLAGPLDVNWGGNGNGK